MKKLVLSVVFAALGTFAMAQQTGGKKAPDHPRTNQAEMQKKQDEKLQQMKAELGLSDAQVARIKEMKAKQQEARKQEMAAQKAERVDAMKDKRQAMDAEMKSILTPEQYEKWQQIKADRMQQKKAADGHKDIQRAEPLQMEAAK